MALIITKENLITGGRERSVEKKQLAPEELTRYMGDVYQLHLEGNDESYHGGIEAQEIESFQPEEIKMVFSRKSSGWNIQGIETLLFFGQEYYQNHPKIGQFSIMREQREQKEEEIITVTFKKGQSYNFYLIDPFRQKRAMLRIQC